MPYSILRGANGRDSIARAIQGARGIARAKRHPATEGAKILASVMQHYHLGVDLDRTRDCLTKRRDFSSDEASS